MASKIFVLSGAGVAIVVGALVHQVGAALPAVLEKPPVCLSDRERSQLAQDGSGRDILMAKQINLAMGPTPMLFWHLRGASILGAYVTFWSRSMRDELYEQATKVMADCPN